MPRRPLPKRIVPLGAIMVALSLAACASAPRAATPSAKTPDAAGAAAQSATTASLMGRWILVPGDCVMPAPAEADAQAASEAVVSPAGSVLVLALGGSMSAQQGEFLRKGTWKFDGTSLRIVVEPPPRRIEMGFAPSIESSELRLTGADGMVLVYHRDPFIAVQPAPAAAPAP